MEAVRGWVWIFSGIAHLYHVTTFLFHLKTTGLCKFHFRYDLRRETFAILILRRNHYEYKLHIEYTMLDFNLSCKILKNFENPVENWLHAQELKAAFVNSFKRFLVLLSKLQN